MSQKAGEAMAKTVINIPTSQAAEWMRLSELHGWEQNPRKHGDTVPKLVRAIIRYGWGSPIEARRENGEIIAGHGRMQAAERLAARWSKASERARSKWHPEAVRVALGEVPVRLRDLDEDDAHEAAIADNRIGEDSEWDKDLLVEHLGEFEDDADLMGFEDAEIESAITDEDNEQPDASRLRDGLTYQLLIHCDSEQHQTQLLERFEQEGLQCKPLIS